MQANILSFLVGEVGGREGKGWAIPVEYHLVPDSMAVMERISLEQL